MPNVPDPWDDIFDPEGHNPDSPWTKSSQMSAQSWAGFLKVYILDDLEITRILSLTFFVRSKVPI